MDFDSIRPVLSGVIGGSIALWLGVRWQRRQTSAERRSAATLTQTHKLASILASTLFFSGLIVGVALYEVGGFKDSDWIPFALGAGGGCLAALISLTVVPLARGQSVQDSYAAFALSQQSSPLVVYAILGVGSAGCLWAVAKLLT